LKIYRLILSQGWNEIPLDTNRSSSGEVRRGFFSDDLEVAQARSVIDLEKGDLLLRSNCFDPAGNL
jgi:hypothetical protein